MIADEVIDVVNCHCEMLNCVILGVWKLVIGDEVNSNVKYHCANCYFEWVTYSIECMEWNGGYCTRKLGSRNQKIFGNLEAFFGGIS